MAFKDVVTDDAGVFYVVDEDGDLYFYKYDDPSLSGSGTWANGRVGQRIGTDWGRFTRIVAGGGGVIYAVDAAGDLFFYHDLARDGTANWAAGSGQKIGNDWAQFTAIASGDDGVLYAVTPTGDLRYYRDLARDGTANWGPGSGQIIGTGWNLFADVLSGGGGVLYAITPGGVLRYYRDLARDGTGNWAPGSGQQIGSGWNVFDLVTGAGDGVLYGFRTDGFLLWYRDLARDGTPSWAASGIGRRIASGWQIAAASGAALEGYSVPLSAAPGEVVQFKVSARDPYQVTYYRLKPKEDGSLGIAVGSPVDRPAGARALPSQAWEQGCGWPTDFTLQVGADWASGLYAAQCASTASPEVAATVVFVVKPAPGATADFAVLSNTCTWNAYNDEGGRSQYTTPNAAILSFERPNRQVDPTNTGIDHLARGELWVLGWLEDEGYRFHVYSDLDFHRGIDGLAGYRGLILQTHPEYWTNQMRDHLDAYLAGGGRLIYLAGNGLYEVVDLDQIPGKMILRRGDPDNPRDLFRDPPHNRPERAVLGVAYESFNWMTFDAFQVTKADHPFFQGTGLSNGDVIGKTGLNGGGASGWEMDTTIVSASGAPPPGIQVLARGLNPISANGSSSYGADIAYYETEAGGFVFAAGSLSFGGSLVQDADLQAIVRNALNACLA